MQIRNLVVGELSLREEVFDIAKDIGKVLDSFGTSQSPLTFNPMNSLVGDVLELARSVDEFFPYLAGKFDRCQKVAYTETETHLDSGRQVVIVA
jgi:hypothetical protein